LVFEKLRLIDFLTERACEKLILINLPAQIFDCLLLQNAWTCIVACVPTGDCVFTSHLGNQ